MKLVWVRRLYDPAELKTRDGEPVRVIDPGEINPNKGPAITGARLEIGGVLHSGPVAIHTSSSQWRGQLCHLDMGYEACVLQVVLDDDSTVCRLDGSVIPGATLHYPQEFDETYIWLTSTGKGAYTCARTLRGLEPVEGYHLLTRLMVERLERKYNDFLELYEQSGNNWNEVFYIMLFRSMGAGNNREVYMKLARSVSYVNLCRVKESPLAVEALLLGAAGFLDTESTGRFPDPYTTHLQAEADHLCRRFAIQPMHSREWTVNKHRTASHPAIRIAELAALLCEKEFLFSQLIESRSAEEIRQILSARASEYWDTHYQPSRRGELAVKRIGRMAQDTLTINLAVPMMFTYGKINGDELLQERAIEILESVAAERNRYTTPWEERGVKIENAFFSQALIQLTREYCEKKRCAACQLGKMVLCSPEKSVSLAGIL